jgi:hypothetical protein
LEVARLSRPARTYPLSRPAGGDPRFTIGLVLEVAAVLTAHGYPPPAGGGDDHFALQRALHTFLYAPPHPGSPPDSGSTDPSGKD